jgi:hypothetical protein
MFSSAEALFLWVPCLDLRVARFGPQQVKRTPQEGGGIQTIASATTTIIPTMTIAAMAPAVILDFSLVL